MPKLNLFVCQINAENVAEATQRSVPHRDKRNAMGRSPNPLLNAARSPMRSGSAQLALLELEGKHIEQTIEARRTRFQQSLLLDGRNIEVEA